MDCPHCGIENLIGATVCAACGKSMLSRPKFLEPEAPPGGAPPQRGAALRSRADEPAPTPLWGAGGPAAAEIAPPPGGGLEQAMCRICQSVFDVGGDANGATICPSCRTLSADIDRMGPNDVQIHPSTIPTESFANRIGSADLRPKPIAAKKAGLRTGPVVAVVGLVLGLAGLGIVAIAQRETDRSKEIVGEVRAESVTIEPAPTDGFIARHEMRVKLDVVREEARSFGGNTSRVVDVQMTTLQTSEAAFQREDDRGPIFDVTTQGRIVEQTGKIGAEDARDASLYPWLGAHPVVRVRAASNAPLAQLDGAPVTPGADVLPLFHVGAVRPESLTYQIGDRWKADLVLPALVTRQARMFVASFPAEFTYAGRAVKNGYACAAFRVTAQAPTEMPGPYDDAFNRKSGKIVGALWVDLTTGIVAGADLELDVRFWKDAGRVEDDLRIRGRVTIDRK